MERTNRGFHYWFKRPAIADSLGYFDGAAQREPKIDFKSICSTGTSGVILVAPSPGKTWIRQKLTRLMCCHFYKLLIFNFLTM